MEYIKLVPKRPSDIPLEDFQRFRAWRPYQREAIAKTLQAIDEGVQDIILVAPTGFGKSLYAMAVSWLLLGFKPEENGWSYEPPVELEGFYPENNKAYVVTETKQLQEQYRRDFSFIKTIKGRSNYPCPFLSDPKLGIEMTAAECVERAGEKCPLKAECPYFIARAEAVRAPVTIHNYAYFLNALNYTNVWPEADITIFDEAHLAESKLADFVEFSITSRQLKYLNEELPRVETPEEVLSFLLQLRTKLNHELINTKAAMEGARGERLKELSRHLDVIERLYRKVEFLLNNFDSSWIIELKSNALFLRPVWVKRWGHLLTGHATVNIYMSATISRKNIELLGVPAEDIEVIEVPSTFPVYRRPITLHPSAPRINVRNEQTTLPRAVELMDRLLDLHFRLGHKGVIHTANTRYAQYAYNHSRHKDRLLLAFGRGREKAIEEFQSRDEPVALIGPNLETGIDLKYDQARFQIILKVPFLNLGDEKTRRRKEEDPDWFLMATSHRLVQAYGRSNRAEDDFSITYVLDANARMLIYSEHVPRWFREAVIPAEEALKLLGKFTEGSL